MENGKTTNLMKFKILPITTDASFRKFYRLFLNKNTRIIVFAEKEKYKNLIAYSAINKFLISNKILAPRLYNHYYNKGVIIIEDFGNLTFYEAIKKKKNKLFFYKQLVNLLLKIQKIKVKFKVKTIIKGTYNIEKYTNKHLFKESDLFFDWYLPLFLNKKKALNLKKKAKKILLKLYNSLNFPNEYFVHRDYHIQNLMKVGKRIGVIDTQDALIGNPAYDLASLIDDVRIKTPNQLKKQIYDYYLKKTLKIHKTNKEKFLNDFNVLSVQRSLKIIGIFSRLFKRDNKNQYLKYIPYTWKLLEMRMKNEKFLDLKKIIFKNVSKKNRKKIIFK